MLLSLIAIIATIASCRKDAPVPAGAQYNPTYMIPDIPSYVTGYLGVMPDPADNPLTTEGVKLGQRLFYEKMLSNDLSMSCASCHKQENAFADPRQYSQGTNGAYGNRNAMAVINMGWTNALFWDGRRSSLEGQAHDPVTNPIEMRNTWPVVVQRLQADTNYRSMFFAAFGTSTVDSLLVTKAIAQFERTMFSFNSPFDAFFYGGDTTILNNSQKRGYYLFFGAAECVHCHSGPLLTDNSLRNNGLDQYLLDGGYAEVTGSASDSGKFKVPTLRNIELTAPYMHDGRFTTLDQVVDHYNSGVQSSSPNLDVEMTPYLPGLGLNAQQKADLVAFLKTLTDQQFVTNSDYSDPN